MGGSAITSAGDTYAVRAGILEAVRAFRSESAGPVVGRLLLAVLDVAAGVVALVRPGITALDLVLWVAAWAVARRPAPGR
jgi:uncharacterized membrane protein HdeD (DUF308 family)